MGFSITFNSLLIGSDCGALNSYIVLENGVGRIDGHLVVRLVSVRQAEVIVQALNLEEIEIIIDWNG